jgi:hypothetical protein
MVEKENIGKKPPKPNRDPLTGEPGAHPVGVGVGTAVGGGVAGAALGAAGAAVAGGVAAGGAMGAAAGPIGAVVGAVAGGVVGGMAGKEVAEHIDPTSEAAYWRAHHETRPYYKQGMTYQDDYLPAYQYGWESKSKYAGREYADVEPSLRSEWARVRAKSRLEWEQARQAIRDAWDRAGAPPATRPPKKG